MARQNPTKKAADRDTTAAYRTNELDQSLNASKKPLTDSDKKLVEGVQGGFANPFKQIGDVAKKAADFFVNGPKKKKAK